MINALLFCAVALVGILSLAALARLRMKLWVRVAGTFLCTAAAITLIDFAIQPKTLSGFDLRSALNGSPYREFVLFFFLLIGMVARVLSLAIEKVRVGDGGLDVDRWQFIYPMLFAVPTFGTLLAQSDASRLTFTEIVLAFQTGFFWQTILRRTEEQVSNAR